MTSVSCTLRYRPEVDGLRAVAVVAVALYHAGLGVSGGYVGVDVFFVISGFLITSLIIADLELGKFKLVNFWERRLRRIIPAVLLVSVTTLAVGWLVLLPAELTRLGRSASWQALFAGNIFFWRNTGYFAPEAAEQPLLHTWSLAVEEQFYLIVPLLLLGFFRFPALRRRSILLGVFALVIILSLVANVAEMSFGLFTFGRPSTAFFLLHTRAWELACGVFIALIPASWTPRSHALREGLSLLGLSGILLPCFLYSDATRFPGLAAVPPCAGTALLILASTCGRSVAADHLPASARLLAASPVVFIGHISYSLYLWHWPVFAFGNYYALATMEIGQRLALVAFSFVLAVLSWRFVETPFRKRKLCAQRSTMLLFAASGIVVVFGLGHLAFIRNGFPSRFPLWAQEYLRSNKDDVFFDESSIRDVLDNHLLPLGNSDPQVPIRLLLWGDSHAMAAAPAFDELLKERELSGRKAAAFRTAPVFGASWSGRSSDAKAFNKAVFEYILRNHIVDVVLACRWELYAEFKDPALDSALLDTIEQLVKAGVRPWVMTQVPAHQFDPRRALVLGRIFERDLTSVMTKTNGWNGIRGIGKEMLRQIEVAGGRVIDSRPSFLDASGNFYIIEKDGIALYSDKNHLSTQGARAMLTPVLRETIGHSFR